MYKVLIADDEAKVIQLIKTLINWEQLELVGTARDGIQALEMIEVLKPDIVITDIRMPGYDGIELIRRAKAIVPSVDFVIVSGYQHFDYAHNAIKYDVKDYLLKPLKQEEINRTLTKLITKYESDKKKEFDTNVMIKRLKKDESIIRSEFATRLFENYEETCDELTSETLFGEYKYNMTREYYRMLSLKADMPFKLGNEELLKVLIDKAATIGGRSFNNNVSDKIIYKALDRVYILFNYDREDQKNIRQAIHLIIDEVTSLRDLFQSVYVTVALSDVTVDLKAIKPFKEQVDMRMMNKFLPSTNRLIESDMLASAEAPLTIYFKEEQKNTFVQLIRELDIDKFKALFNSWSLTLTLSKDIDGYGYIQLANAVKDLTLETLKRFDLVEGHLKLEKSFSELEYGMSRSVSALFSYTLAYLLDLLEAAKVLRRKRNRGPVEDAIDYINNHYNEALSLDQVSEIVGFNASYFSTLFKKETGQKFLEYVTQVRVTYAKEHLADSSISVSEIAGKCGYLDVKHFSKQFKKLTGLTPAKYRKLYY